MDRWAAGLKFTATVSRAEGIPKRSIWSLLAWLLSKGSFTPPPRATACHTAAPQRSEEERSRISPRGLTIALRAKFRATPATWRREMPKIMRHAAHVGTVLMMPLGCRGRCRQQTTSTEAFAFELNRWRTRSSALTDGLSLCQPAPVRTHFASVVRQHLGRGALNVRPSPPVSQRL